MDKEHLWKSLAAEFIGTFLLCFIGCGSIVHYDVEKMELTGIAICFGLIVMINLIIFGPVHINPAVTVAFLAVGKMNFIKALLYVLTQCIGAIIAIATLKGISSGVLDTETFGHTQINSKITPVQGFCIEFFLTFVLILLVCGTSDPNRIDHSHTVKNALLIGLCVTVLVIMGGPITGTGINPARVLGPCIINWRFENHWIYWFGPILGGMAAALLYENVFKANLSNNSSHSINTNYDEQIIAKLPFSVYKDYEDHFSIDSIKEIDPSEYETASYTRISHKKLELKKFPEKGENNASKPTYLQVSHTTYRHC